MIFSVVSVALTSSRFPFVAWPWRTATWASASGCFAASSNTDWLSSCPVSTATACGLQG